MNEDSKSDFSGKKALVTGGLGFIGSNLVRELVRAGAHVVVVDNLEPKYGGNRFNVSDVESELTIHVADVRNSSEIESDLEGCDFIFNLAAQTSHVGSMTDPSTDLAINCVAQLEMLEMARRVCPGARIVFTSTRQVYGKPDYLPVDERHPIRPVDTNGISKWAGEQYHLLYSQAYGIRASVLRLTNVYGPRMRVRDARQTFLGIWVRNLLEGNPILIFGDGKQLRDFNYVDDCVRAILMTAMSDAAIGKTYNVGSLEVVDLNNLASTMIALGFGGTASHVPFPAERAAIDIGDYYSDFSLMRNEVGWSPAVELREGLRTTLGYYKENLAHYV